MRKFWYILLGGILLWVGLLAYSNLYGESWGLAHR